MLPVIYLAFANSSSAPLSRLNEEDNSLVHTLHNRWVKEQHFHVHRDSHATVDTLRHSFTQFKDQLILFHFAGHAGSEELFLRSGEANATGLAEMLSEQANLQLVFLNGCSTLGQVNGLLTLGIPAVIATSAPIDDTLAMRFSRHFYHMLEVGGTYREAYQSAAAYLKAAGQAVSGLRDRIGPQAQQEEVLPWGIYLHPDKQDVLDQGLPTGQRKDLPPGFHPQCPAY